MKKQKKKYSRPRKPFDKVRIEEENLLRETYGLKNKKEIWKADAAIGRIRNLAKQLITANEEEKQAFVERLKKKGFEVDSIADALALDKENWLKRRLQTVLVAKGMTTTPKQARQLITHKHVSIGDQVVNIPSYQVSLEEDTLVKLDIVLKTAKKGKSKEEEIKKEVLEKESSEKEEIKEVGGNVEQESGVKEDQKIEGPASETSPKEVKEETKVEKEIEVTN